MFVVCWMVSDVCLCGYCSLLFVVCRSLFVVWCLLFVVCSVLFVCCC